MGTATRQGCGLDKKPKEGNDTESEYPEDQSEGDIEYVDDDLIDEMDHDDMEGESDGSDFKTMKESEFDEDEAANFNDGDILNLNKNLENDSVC